MHGTSLGIWNCNTLSSKPSLITTGCRFHSLIRANRKCFSVRTLCFWKHEPGCLLVWSSHNRLNQIKSSIYHVRIHKRKRQRLSLSMTLLTNISLKPCELFPPHPSHKVIVANSLMLKSYKSQNVGSLHFVLMRSRGVLITLRDFKNWMKMINLFVWYCRVYKAILRRNYRRFVNSSFF